MWFLDGLFNIKTGGDTGKLDCLQKIIAETGAVYLFGYQNPDPVSASLIGHHRLRHGLGIAPAALHHDVLTPEARFEAEYVVKRPRFYF